MQAKHVKHNRNLATGILYSITISMVCLICGICMITSLLINATTQESNSLMAAQGVLFISVIIGCYISGKRINQKPLILGFATAVSIFMLLVGVHIFAYPGTFKNTLMTLITTIAGCMTGVILSTRKKKKKLRFTNC